MKKFLALVLLALVSAFPADARTLRGTGIYTPPPVTAYPKSMINAQGSPTMAINVMKNCGAFVPAIANRVYLDANGYDTSPDGRVQYNCGGPLIPGTSYTVLWPASRGPASGTQAVFAIGDSGITGCTNAINMTVTGCAGGNSKFTQVTPGQAMSVQFTATITSLYIGFPVGTNGSGEVAIIRTSDLARYNYNSANGTFGEYLTSEFVATYVNEYPAYIRFMDPTNVGSANFNGESKWAYRRKVTDLSWVEGKTIPGALVTTLASGTNAYTSAGATDTPGAWTDGEQLQLGFANSLTGTTYSAQADNGSGVIRLTVGSSVGFTTGMKVYVQNFSGNDPAYWGGTLSKGTWTVTVVDSTHVDLQNSVYQSFASGYSGYLNAVGTIDVAGRGAKELVGRSGYYLGLNDLQGASACGNDCLYTLTYNATLDQVLVTGGTLVASFPIEAFVHLCNLSNAGFWQTIPMYRQDDFVTQSASYVLANLNTPLGYTPEDVNENWNGGFPQNGFFANIGLTLGFQYQNGEQYLGSQGLRVISTANLAGAVFSGSPSRFNPVLAWQAGGDINVLNFLMKGQDLLNSKANAVVGAVFTTGTPGKVTTPGGNPGGFRNTFPVKFTTTGALPTPLVAGTTYYVSNADPSGQNFYLATTANGAPIALGGSPSGTHTATYTNTFYDAKVGVNHNTNPSRPIDAVVWQSYAPYTGGTHLFYGQDAGQFFIQPSTYSASLYQSVINQWEAGNTSGSIATQDSDIFPGISVTATIASVSGNTITTTAAHNFKVGSGLVVNVTGGTTYSGLKTGYQLYNVNSVPSTTTLTMIPYTNGFASGAQVTPGAAGTGTSTLSWVGGACNPFSPSANCSGTPAQPFGGSNAFVNTLNGYMQFGEWLAAQFDGDRPPGKANLKTVQYEASLELEPPPSAIVTALGLTGVSPYASLQAARTAYNFSQAAADQQVRFFKAYMGTDPTFFTYGAMPHSLMPSTFKVYGPRDFVNSWAILSGLDGSTPYGFYNGVTTFNTTP